MNNNFNNNDERMHHERMGRSGRSARPPQEYYAQQPFPAPRSNTPTRTNNPNSPPGVYSTSIESVDTLGSADMYKHRGSSSSSASSRSVGPRTDYQSYAMDPISHTDITINNNGNPYDSHISLRTGTNDPNSNPMSVVLSPVRNSMAMMNGASNRNIVRKKTVKRLELFYGNLVINCPVPDYLLHKGYFKEGEEFTNMRYSAVTCDPDEFIREKYTLRSALYGRSTELFIVMTMYNEDEDLFCRTMTAVMKNIAHLCSRDRSKTWGPDGWKKVVVCVMSDGRSKINPRTLKVLGLMGLFQEDIMKTDVNGQKTQAHLFEYTTQVCVDNDMAVHGTSEKWVVPVQMLFCLKEENKKKLNSHRWFFNAFAPILNPNVCVLLDVGTKPTSTSIYHLWKTFDLNPNVGGACGEITADLGTACVNVLNPIVAAQNFEYKMSNILDKPLESVFGYISVLPGAFSAYRYRALLNSADGKGPLASYFRGEKLHEGSANVFASNMFLAEDRILCFELVAKRDHSWTLKYVKSAQAETDVPNGVAEFISQRRRWLNGSFFASIHAMVNWQKIWNTNHSLAQKFLFQLQLLYNVINTVFAWFGIGMFYLTFYYLSQGLINVFDKNGSQIGSFVFQGLRQLYIFTIVIIVIASLGNRPQGSKGIFIFTMILFSLIMLAMLFMAGWNIYATVNEEVRERMAINPNASFSAVFRDAFLSSTEFRDIFVALISTYGIYLITSILYGEPYHMFTSFFQYLLLLPSFVNILMIYAFCNTHDISWGTKGDNGAAGLGGAKKVSGGNSNQVEVELPFLDNKDKASLNADYARWAKELSRRPKAEPPKRDLSTKLNDWYRSFRTRLVLTWLFSNAALIVVLTESHIYSYVGNKYLTFVFWSTFGISAVRMIGSLLYLLAHWASTFGSCRCW